MRAKGTVVRLPVVEGPSVAISASISKSRETHAIRAYISKFDGAAHVGSVSGAASTTRLAFSKSSSASWERSRLLRLGIAPPRAVKYASVLKRAIEPII